MKKNYYGFTSVWFKDIEKMYYACSIVSGRNKPTQLNLRNDRGEAFVRFTSSEEELSRYITDAIAGGGAAAKWNKLSDDFGDGDELPQVDSNTNNLDGELKKASETVCANCEAKRITLEEPNASGDNVQKRSCVNCPIYITMNIKQAEETMKISLPIHSPERQAMICFPRNVKTFQSVLRQVYDQIATGGAN